MKSGKWVYTANNRWDAKIGDGTGYVVGYDTITGMVWEERNYATSEEAAARVHYLNGGISKEVMNKIDRIIKYLDNDG